MPFCVVAPCRIRRPTVRPTHMSPLAAAAPLDDDNDGDDGWVSKQHCYTAAAMLLAHWRQAAPTRIGRTHNYRCYTRRNGIIIQPLLVNRTAITTSQSVISPYCPLSPSFGAPIPSYYLPSSAVPIIRSLSWGNLSRDDGHKYLPPRAAYWGMLLFVVFHQSQSSSFAIRDYIQHIFRHLNNKRGSLPPFNTRAHPVGDYLSLPQHYHLLLSGAAGRGGAAQLR